MGKDLEIKIGEEKFDLGKEIIGTKIVLNTILTLLGRKGLLSQEEFDKIKKEITNLFKKDHPSIFKKETKIK